MTDHRWIGPWQVRVCPEHGLVESHSSGFCSMYLGGANGWCGRMLSEPFTVTRAPTAADLDGAGQARITDPATARAAGAIKITRGSQRWKVLEAVKQVGVYGATSHELEEQTGIRYASLTPRIGELKRGGYIKATDRTRTGRYGVEQEVLVVSGVGMQWPERVDDDDDESEPWENPDVLFED